MNRAATCQTLGSRITAARCTGGAAVRSRGVNRTHNSAPTAATAAQTTNIARQPMAREMYGESEAPRTFPISSPLPYRLLARVIAVGNHRRIKTASGGCARAIESVSSELPAKTQNTPGGSVIETVKMTSPAAQSETSRLAPYLVASRAPGIEATPIVSTASEVIEPVAEKLSPRSERIAGSDGGIAKRITRRLKAVSQTSPSEMTVRRKEDHPNGQIFDESGTGL